MVIPPSQGLENENKGDFQYYPIMLGFQNYGLISLVQIGIPR
jgi:hypothetical protein